MATQWINILGELEELERQQSCKPHKIKLTGNWFTTIAIDKQSDIQIRNMKKYIEDMEKAYETRSYQSETINSLGELYTSPNRKGIALRFYNEEQPEKGFLLLAAGKSQNGEMFNVMGVKLTFSGAYIDDIEEQTVGCWGAPKAKSKQLKLTMKHYLTSAIKIMKTEINKKVMVNKPDI